jgi:hypothetical protein
VPPHPADRPAPAASVPPFDRGAVIAAGGAALLAFLVYALTVEPSVPTGDSGELITAASVLGVAHPPGYPLYMLLGHLATRVPGASPALDMSLLSALLDAIAVGLVFLVIHRLVALGTPASAGRRTPYAAAASGALALAFSSLFWAYSVVAEVFALENLFAALLLLIAIEWCRRPARTRLLWLFMLLFGLALCNQQTIVLFVPAFLVLAAQGWKLLPRAEGRFRISPPDLGIAVCAFAVGLLPYAYLPIAAAQGPVMNWGDPTTPGRFLTQVMRGNYGTSALGATGQAGSLWENLRLLAASLAHDFVYVGLALAAAGLWWAWKHRKAEGIALLVAFVVSGPVFLSYSRPAFPDKLQETIVARFYILPSVPLGILTGLGAWWLLGQAERVSSAWRGLVTALASVAVLAVPAVAAAAHYSATDQSGNYVAYEYGRDILRPLAPHALLVSHGDANYTSLVYAQYVDHYRPDVAVVDTELLKLPTYVAQVRHEHPGVLIPFTRYDGGAGTSLNQLVAANLGTRPVYAIGHEPEAAFGKPFAHLDFGLATQLLPEGAAPGRYTAIRADPARFAGLHFPTKQYPSSSWEGSAIAPAYASAAFAVAYALQTAEHSDPALIERMYRSVIALDPTDAGAYENLGLVLYRSGGEPGEIVSLWTAFLKLDPTAPQAGSIRSLLEKLKATQGES